MIMIFDTIGYAQTAYKTINDMPIQGVGIADNLAQIVIDKSLQPGLQDLAEFSHIYVIFHLHKMSEPALTVIPFLDTKPHGIFATRSPKRPNPIGLSIAEIDHIEDNIIYVKDIDLLDGTPILDIKPYIQAFDNIKNTRDGWYEQGMDPKKTRSDGRFK
ncbi:tRNA (N6-threonylcarbamoyladenosine(37)-N6)-methyltransferase TrmO [Shewanella schlegeliana]|uniref:tRNA (N6-threonylcarbamoyladenosine(37)-N6)-methyltransferase TrmO n=2 Tax=Shewanella schlegeliana TaxID=190308 RepID=A0ABS1T0M9_9GAMM|nr:tRNA (N6-threonylcarbamoyladenosine(37)-N6)-methyltransferase TrmO [Shewanella schlegeliana]